MDKITLKQKIGIAFFMLAGVFLIHMVANWSPIRVGAWSYDILYLAIFIPPAVLLTFFRKPPKINKPLFVLAILIVNIGVYELIFSGIYQLSLFSHYLQDKELGLFLGIITNLVVSIGYMLSGCGIFLLKNWARRLFMALCLINIFLIICNLTVYLLNIKIMAKTGFNILIWFRGHIYPLGLNVLAYLYFIRRRTKALFQ
jgi:hypothetical protein